MQLPAIQQFRQKLADDEPVFGLWVTLESASITEMAVALGMDWVVIDAEHGHLDWRDIIGHVRAAVRSRTVVVVRVAELNRGVIKRVLDIGADGVIVPWVETADQLGEAVACARYPTEGVRGIGAERATGWGECVGEHVSDANGNILVIPLIESVKAGDNIDEMLGVPGVDLFFIGPSDFSATAGYRGQWEGPGVADKILAVKDRIRAAGKQCGLLATSNENLIARGDAGFRMLGIGIDGSLLLRGIHGALAAIGRDRKITPTLDPNDPAGSQSG